MRAYIRAGLILLVVGFLVLRIIRPGVNAYQFQKLVQSEVEEAWDGSEAPRPGLPALVLHSKQRGSGGTADAADSKSAALRGMRVQIPPSAPST